MTEFKCPKCGKNIIERNTSQAGNNGDIIIKSRLVFLNGDGNILCRCINCKNVIGLPLSFMKSTETKDPSIIG